MEIILGEEEMTFKFEDATILFIGAVAAIGVWVGYKEAKSEGEKRRRLRAARGR